MCRDFLVVPCGGEKLSRAAPARDLYVGQMFRNTLGAALAEAEGTDAEILVLSALHGLVRLDQVLEPYDVRMGDAGSVTAERLRAQAEALGIDWTATVYGLLPSAYLDALDAALRPSDVYVQDVYETCRGIGEQRGVNRHVREIAALEIP